MMHGFLGIGEIDGQLDAWLVYTVNAGISGTFDTKGLPDMSVPGYLNCYT